MTDEKYVLNLVLDLYWAGFHQGVAYQKSGQPMTAAAIEARQKSIKSAQKKILARIKAATK